MEREYYLNFEQALLLSIRSDTPKAKDVREVMVKVFSGVVYGMPIEADLMQRVEKVLGPLWPGKTDAFFMPKGK